ncbi:hypothetical protein [Tissierella praeacuta]|uniref:hypothetical protein n=1 Tax=Tissierella praeacuta TaxID=43131 RepID=UPI000934E7F9|nr:hypothetical protein [Tissierella praeacuta]
MIGIARKLYDTNLKRFYYNGGPYRNYEGDRGRESIWAYEDRDYKYYIDNMGDEFDFYWDDYDL